MTSITHGNCTYCTMLGNTACRKACLHINAWTNWPDLAHNDSGKIHLSFTCDLWYTQWWIRRYKNNLYTIWLSYWKKAIWFKRGSWHFTGSEKKIIVDFYISCNATIRNKYVFRYVSDISRINIKSWTTSWNFLWKSYIWHKIWVFHTVADDSSHNSRWQFTVET